MSGSRKLVTLISFIRIIDTHINRLHRELKQGRKMREKEEYYDNFCLLHYKN